MGKSLRRLGLLLAVLVCLAAWGGVLAAYLADVGVAGFTIALTIAAFATEALIWALAILGGWTVFANRRAFLARLTGRKEEAADV